MKRVLSTTVLAALLLFTLNTQAEGELVAHYSLDNETTGITNLGSNGSLSDLAPYTGGALPTFHSTGGFDGGGYASFSGSG